MVRVAAAGFGRTVLAALRSVQARLLDHPESFPGLYRDTRRAGMPRDRRDDRPLKKQARCPVYELTGGGYPRGADGISRMVAAAPPGSGILGAGCTTRTTSGSSPPRA